MKVKSLSRVRLLATPWTAAYQAPPSMGFSRQEYWSGVPLPSPLNMSRLVLTFLPRSKRLLISLLQSPSAVILEPRKIKSDTVSTVSPSKSLQSWPTLCDPLDCSPPGSSIYGILQARILEWVAIPFCRGSSQPRD